MALLHTHSHTVQMIHGKNKEYDETESFSRQWDNDKKKREGGKRERERERPVANCKREMSFMMMVRLERRGDVRGNER